MTTSRLGVITDALVTTLSAVDGLLVLDGPTPSGDGTTEWVVVGGDGLTSPDEESSSSDQSWAGLGAERRDEEGSVTCAVVVRSGDPEFKAVRDRALVLLGLVEDALRADPTLGGAVSKPGWAHLTGVRTYQRGDSGALVRVVFTVGFKARI